MDLTAAAAAIAAADAREDADPGAEPGLTPDQGAALAELRAWQEQQGITFDNPDELVGPYGKQKTEEIRGEPWT